MEGIGRGRVQMPLQLHPRLSAGSVDETPRRQSEEGGKVRLIRTPVAFTH
jgi:hypothetical protein